MPTSSKAAGAVFQKIHLLYNPASGAGRFRLERMEQAARILAPLGGAITLEATTRAGGGGEQARRAIAAGADLVLACGGDGTSLDVLQGVVGTDACFGVLPFGTANVLAGDLGLPADPLRAARRLLEYRPRPIALGVLEREQAEPLYFTVAAGAGAHALLIANSTRREKSRAGFAAYYLSGFKLLFRHDYDRFTVELTLPDGTARREVVWEAVAMRVSSFGRFLSRWRPGSSLTSPHLQIVLLRESSRLRLILYVARAICGLANRSVNDPQAQFEMLPVRSVRFPADDAPRISQADGESLKGVLRSMRVADHSLRMLMPPKKS